MARPLRLLRGAAAALFVLGIPLASCADLSPLPEGTCGNDVLDAFEDCDGHGLGSGTSCAPPGDAHECRFLCGGDAGARCPAGWGCGGDGVCRQSSGAFQPLGELVPFPAVHRILAGDFDGDGITEALVLGEHDALGRSPARIVAPPTPTSDSEVFPVSRPLAAPAVSPSGADGLASIAFADRGGVALFGSTSNNEGTYAAFSTFVPPPGASLRVIAVDVISEKPGDELVYFLDQKALGATLEQATGPLSSKTLVHLPAGEQALSGPILAGQFDAASPCPDLVFTYENANNVLLFPPCRKAGLGADWNVDGAPHFIALPAGAAIDQPAIIADLDLDGNLDVLIGASGQIYVAWGRGDGTFGSEPAGGGLLNEAGLPTLANGALSAFPLATADINADGIVDFVVPEGVILSQNGASSLTFHNVGEPWDHAVIADLNDNGMPDIVAGSLVGLDLNFLNNAGGGTLNPSIIPTNGATENLAVGDFDGDLVNDLAFMVVLDRPGALIDELTVAFGEAHGPPSKIEPVARLREIVQISAAHLLDSSGADGLADIVCISQDAQLTDDFYSFPGEGGRVMISPLPLHDGKTDALPIAMAFGTFDEDTRDIAAVGVDSAGQLTLWHVDTDALGAPAPPRASEPLPSPFDAALTKTQHLNYPVHAVALDLTGGNGQNQFVVLSTYGTDGVSGAAVVIADYDPASQVFTARPEQPLPASVIVSEDSALNAFDVDGDDLPDLVLSTGKEGAPGDVLVLWNDGKGGVLTDSPAHIAAPGGVRGFACLPAASGHGCALVITSGVGTSVAAARADRTFDVTPIPSLPAGKGVITGDFNGDGLTDVAVVEDLGLQFFSAVPKHS